MASARLCWAAGQDQLLCDVLQMRIQCCSGSGALHMLKTRRELGLLLLHALLPLQLLTQDFRLSHSLVVGGVRGRREMRGAQAHVEHAVYAGP